MSKTRPSTDPALMVMYVNIEGLSSAKKHILAELCTNHECDVLCMQETHRGSCAVRPRVLGANLVSTLFIRDPCTCDSTSTSITDNIEPIPAIVNSVTVNSYYKPPSHPFDFRSNTSDTTFQLIIGYFNSYSTEWG